jgi:hypothetical protein
MYETLLSPGYLLVQTVSLVIAHTAILGFVKSVDSAGFDHTLTTGYELIGRVLSTTFGDIFLEKMFSDGPFLFALYVGFFPVLLYLSINTVFRSSIEKQVGGMELLCYGPVDKTSCYLASFIRDLILSLIFIFFLLILFIVDAGVLNLLVTRKVIWALFALPAVSAAVFAYGMLIGSVSDSSTAGLALFLGIMVLFAAVLVSSYAMAGANIRRLSTILNNIVQWISPGKYWVESLRAIELGQAGLLLLSIVKLLILVAVLLTTSHLLLRKSRVRK